jgi:TolB-like protein
MDAMYRRKTDNKPLADQCLSLARGRKWEACAELARSWLDSDPLNADAALYLLNALKAPATVHAYQAALEAYASLERRLEREYERSPASEVAQLAGSIRERLAEISKPPVASLVPSRQVGDRGRLEKALGRMTTSRFASIPFATFLFLGATSFTARNAASLPATGPGADRPSVAVIDVRNTAGDSATAWLELGLPQLVASNIARLSGVDVVSPERVREARQALGLPRGSALTRDDLRQLGLRSGARWVVTGGIVRSDSLYVLEMTMEKTTGDVEPRPLTVTSSSLIALADQAATKLAGLATTDGTLLPPGVRRK